MIRMPKRFRLAAIALAVACVAGCGEEDPKELARKHQGDIMTKAKFEKMKAENAAKRKAEQDARSKSIGASMVKRTMETAAGTSKKDNAADDKVKKALDRDFGAVPDSKGGNGDGK